MNTIHVLNDFIVYENPRPNINSRHGFFPGIAKLPTGELICLFVVGEAFESVDQTTYISCSNDNGKTWSIVGPLYDKSLLHIPMSDCFKPSAMCDGRIIAMGYRFDRSNPDRELVNAQTGGLRGGDVAVSFSDNNGKTWLHPKSVQLSRPDLLEISGPCIQLKSGTLISGGAAFPGWETGSTTCGHGGILLRSKDGGETWNDDVFYYQTSDDSSSPYETRFTQMPDGRIVAIVWAMEHKIGKNLPNRVVVSKDDGMTWSKPIDTGITAQASSIVGWKDNTLLSIHSHREGEDVGLHVRVMQIGEDTISVLAEKKIWGNAKSKNITSFQDMSSSLRFGQPSLTKLENGDVLAVFWSIEDGQGRIKGIRLQID